MAITAVDAVIEARWVVPVAPARAVLPDHALVIDSGQIEAIMPIAHARATYAPAKRVALEEHVLIPGLINLHTHAAMSLLRGIADDLPLMEWLNHHIWPAEQRWVSEDFVYDGTRLACAEMARGGITCFNDMYFFPRAAALAALDSRIRAVPGLIVIEFPSPYAADAQDYFNKGWAVRDELRGEPLLSFCLAPHAPYTLSDESLRKVATYAEELDLPIHMHVHETRSEVDESVQSHGVRPLQRLNQLGVLGPGLTAVHAIYLEPRDIDLLAQHGCHVAHCPSSNLKLGNGIAPIAELINAGVNVGLGTDGAASNNRLDLLEEMRLAALLAKGTSADAAAVPAWQALEMATVRGARALGLERKIGTLEVGKCADITAVRLSDIELIPCQNPLSNLVYAAGREHVTHVWVSGEPVLDNREIVTIDVGAVKAKAAYWRAKISGR